MILLERDGVLQRLHSLRDEAAEGRGRLALIRGEAGIGKTSVIRQFLDDVDDAHVLWGACDDLVTPRPLGPIWDMAFDEPSLTPALESGNRNEVFSELFGLMARSLRPTIMVIEDVHWADESTLDLIKFLGRRIDRTHGLLVLTYRDGEVTDDHPLRVALGDLPYGVVERIPLDPLSRDGVAELAGPGGDVESLWQLTSGNPFFVSEAVAAIGPGVPSSIRDAVNARVLRLSPEARQLVELASVVPSRIEINLAASVLGNIGGPVAEVEEAGILEVSGDKLRFRHELARRAVEGELPEIERRRLNRLIVEHGEPYGLGLARLAHHACEAGDADASVRFLPAAARRASLVESHSEAVSHLRALEPFLDRFSREELADHYDLWAYEEYLWAETGSDIIDKAIAVRKTLDDPEKLGNSLLVASRIAWVGSMADLAKSRAEEAVDVLEEVGGEPLAFAYSTMSQLAMLANREAETLEFGARALEIAGDGPSRVRAHALNNVGAVVMNNHYPKGIDDLEESYRMASELGLPHDASRACVNLAWGYLQHKELDLAIEWIDKGAAIMNESEMPSFESYADTERSMWMEARGDWDNAEAMCVDVFERSASLATSRVTVMTLMAKFKTRRGEGDALEAISDAFDRAEQAAELQRLGPIAAVAAEYAWLGGAIEPNMAQRVNEIREEAYELGASWSGGEIEQWLWLAGSIDSVSEAAPEPIRLLASGAWEYAARWWQGRGIPYERAVALSTGDVEAKLEALAAFDSLGATVPAARLRSELQEQGVKGIPRGPKPSTKAHPLGLTARQTDVLELLKEDLTNAEIADRLFISTRTVDHHVSAILARLGAENRSDAAELARSVPSGA